jgi:hypothetical protein
MKSEYGMISGVGPKPLCRFPNIFQPEMHYPVHICYLFRKIHDNPLIHPPVPMKLANGMRKFAYGNDPVESGWNDLRELRTYDQEIPGKPGATERKGESH